MFTEGVHVGYVKIGYDPPKNERTVYKPRNYPNMDDIHIITYDCEWNWNITKRNKEGKAIEGKAEDPSMVSVAYKDKSKLFSSFKEFFVFIQLLSSSKPVYAYAHNASNVEHRWVIKEILKNKKLSYYKEFRNVDGRKIKTFNHKLSEYIIEFRDTYLFLPSSLEGLSKSFNMEIYKEPFKDYWEIKWDINNEEHRRYALLDSTILLDIIMRFNESLNVLLNNDSRKWLLSSTSLSAIMKDRYLSKYSGMLCCPDYNNLFQQFYYGGRCECFHIGKVEGVIKEIDITSSYPYVMSQGLPLVSTKEDHDTIAYLLKICYKDSYSFRPLIPIRDKGKLLFPFIKNKHLTILWDFEFEAIKDYSDYEIIDTFYFKKVYVDEPENLFNERLKHPKNTAMNTVIKFALNGSYGGLALNPERECRILYNNELPESKIKYASFYWTEDHEDNFKWFLNKEWRITKNNFPVASYITAFSSERTPGLHE